MPVILRLSKPWLSSRSRFPFVCPGRVIIRVRGGHFRADRLAPLCQLPLQFGRLLRHGFGKVIFLADVTFEIVKLQPPILEEFYQLKVSLPYCPGGPRMMIMGIMPVYRIPFER